MDKHTQFKGRDHILEMAVSSCCEQGEWDLAEMLTLKDAQPEGRARKLSALAEACCRKNNWEGVFRIISNYAEFPRKDEVLWKWISVCREQKRWNETIGFLQELLRWKQINDPQAAEALFALAEVHLARGDFKSAEEYCRKTEELRRRTLGRRHVLWEECVYLFARISNAKGEYIRADGYMAMLSDTSNRQCWQGTI